MKHNFTFPVPTTFSGGRTAWQRSAPSRQLFLCVVFWLAWMASGEASTGLAPEIRQFTLQNGMTLIVKSDHRAPTAVNMVLVRVGSMDEVDGTTGVVHVLEHMLFKGTPTA